MTTKNKKDIVIGTFNLDPEEFSPREVKVRITTLVDEDALEKLKKIAGLQKMKYQTLLNQIIRKFVSEKDSKSGKGLVTKETVRQIVLEELKKRA